MWDHFLDDLTRTIPLLNQRILRRTRVHYLRLERAALSKTEFAIARQPASPGGLLGQCAAEGQRVGYGRIAGGIQPWARRRRASVCVCVCGGCNGSWAVRARSFAPLFTRCIL
jgi:hypothetical protein